MANIFRRDLATYPLKRPKLMTAYLDRMRAHLQRLHPDASVEEIDTFIRDLVRERLKRPKMDILDHPSYGVTRERTVDLLNYTDAFTNEIVTPGGAIYMPPSRKRSVLSEALAESVAERNVFKHKQLEAAAAGESVQEQMMKLLQASAKIFNNSIPGAMGTPYSFLYDLPGYNGITSGGQQCVKTGYPHVERMLGGNIYVADLDDVINYVVNHLSVCPYDQVRDVMTKYRLTYPSVDMLFTYFHSCLTFYGETRHVEDRLRTYLETLTDVERAYVFYVYGYKHLLMHNETLMRSYFAEFFRRDIVADPASNPKDIYRVEGDLLAMAMSLNFDVIGREPKLDVAIDTAPEGVQKLLAICRHMEQTLLSWQDLWQTFFRSDTSLARTWEHPNMVRRCVLVSDTDSVIFSTAEIAKWYAPDQLFGQAAQDVSVFSVFVVSQSLEHLFGHMTAGLGIEPAERGLIKMKNEFYYPIFIRSPMAKHYMGMIFIQEGKILPTPKMDIKGLNYRGSDIPDETAVEFLAFAKWIFKEITEHSHVSGTAIIKRIAAHEQRIYTSLMAGEKTFLPTAPIKFAEEYETPLQSNYFYYLLWKDVFEETFGEFVIPNKGYVVPLLDGGKCFGDTEWLAKLGATDPKLPGKLMTFQTQHGFRGMSRVIIPPALKEVPVIIREVMDVRRILHANGRPFFLLARSLGFGFDDKDSQYLASDFAEVDNTSLDITI